MFPPLKPRVSVITPAYNATATIADTVMSALGQTIEDIEVIVIDDGSLKPVAEALVHIRDPRLRIIRTEVNRGVSAARNIALAVARAAVVAQLDADDFWRPDHIEGLLPALDDPTIGLAYSNVEITGTTLLDRAIAVRTPGDGLPTWLSDRSRHPVNDLSSLYKVNPIPSPAVVMRTAAVCAVKGYPQWLKVGEDYYLYIKLLRAGWRFAYVDRMSAVYRWPEQGRGVSFDARLRARQCVKLFSTLALNSAPDRAIFKRLGHELLNLAWTYAPAPATLAGRVRVNRTSMPRD